MKRVYGLLLFLVFASALFGTMSINNHNIQLGNKESNHKLNEVIGSKNFKVQRKTNPKNNRQLLAFSDEGFNKKNNSVEIHSKNSIISGKIKRITLGENSSYFEILIQESENTNLLEQTISTQVKYYNSSTNQYQKSADAKGWKKGDMITGGLSYNAESEEFVLETFSKDAIWQQTPRKRDRIYLAENWRFKTDKRSKGESGEWFATSYDDSSWRRVFVPSCWNTYDDSLEHYQGVGWYRKSFFVPENWSGKQISLHFLGANQRAKIWVNGEYVGSHKGGFTGFSYPVSNLVEPGEQNKLVVKVDSSREYFAVPAKNYIWKNWGGIYREVYIEASNKLSISNSFVTSRVDLEKDTSIENVEVEVKNHREEETNISLNVSVHKNKNLILTEEKENILSIEPSAKDSTSIEFEIKDPLLWSPDHPELYTLKISLMDSSGKTVDVREVTFGIRKLEVKNNKLYLNGEAITLKGVNRHEEYPGLGRAVKEANIRKDFEIMKEANVNFVRLGHYPNHPLTLKLADEYGLLVYEEIPAYRLNAEQLSDNSLVKNAKKQLTEMIKRDYNHPSIIIWGLANEIASHTKEGKRFLQTLHSRAENLDPHRPKTYTTDKPSIDKSLNIADIISLNEYYGWFLFSKTSKLRTVLENLHKRFPQKPIIVSEFGASGVIGRHGNTRFTEEIQAKYLTNHLNIIKSKDYSIGSTIWVFANYRDPTKVMNPTAFMNQKGLVDYYRKPKLAYSTVKTIYSGEEATIPQRNDPIRLTTLDIGAIILFIISAGLFFSGAYRREKMKDLLPTHLFKVLTSPRKFFESIKQEKPKTRTTITFLLFMVLVLSVGLTILIKTITIHHFPIFITRPYWFNYGLRLGLTNPLAAFLPVLTLFSTLTSVHYLLSKKIGKTTSFEESLTLTTWSASPYLLLLPLTIVILFTKSLTLIIGMVILSIIWAIILLAIGTKKKNETTTGKTALITIISYLTPILIIVIFLLYTFWPMFQVGLTA